MPDEIHVHTFLNILTEQQEVRVVIRPINPSIMTTHNLATILEEMAHSLRQYPSEATIAQLKEVLEKDIDV